MAAGAGPAAGRRKRGDPLLAPYLLLLSVGLISLLVILLAFGQLLQGTAPWSHVSAQAKIVGVYHYDAGRGETLGAARQSFAAKQTFAGRVDWSSLPAALDVGARWYDDSGEDWGGIQPATASTLAATAKGSLVPMVRTNAPPGAYTLDVMRYSAGKPVQILGRTNVEVGG